MIFIHQKLTQGKWQKFSLAEQLGNIGSEISRVIYWRKQKDRENTEKAAYRVLELIDLTIVDHRWKFRLKEILRLREIFCDFFIDARVYNVSAKMLTDYYLPFAIISRK